MTQKEVDALLQPRYKVKTPWPPSCNFKAGDIITPDQFTGWHPKDFPIIFEFLPWWSDREVSEMPEYVKNEIGVYKVERFSNKNGFDIFEIKNWKAIKNGSGWSVKNILFMKHEKMLPATEQDYLTYKQQQK